MKLPPFNAKTLAYRKAPSDSSGLARISSHAEETSLMLVP